MLEAADGGQHYPSVDIQIQKEAFKQWISSFQTFVVLNWQHIMLDTLLILFVAYVLFQKTLNTKGPATISLSEKEMSELVYDWKPEPLVPDMPEEEQEVLDNVPLVSKVEGSHLHLLNGPPVTNFVTFDFLNMSQLPAVKEATVACLDKYGCGSCGPRGFYGTSEVHLQLEREVADFMEVDSAISYSEAAATVSSAIPAFAKKGDIIAFDTGVDQPMQTGLLLSRAILHPFKHNDMEDLERVLEEVAAEDINLRRNVLDQRRFIAVDGLYRNYGDICNLPKLVDLKSKYHYRIILNEAYSFGTLGYRGRGLTEHFGVPVSDIDIIMISMAGTLASIGGLCVGGDDVVDHQRLSGPGYCFSASAPPFVNAAARAALHEMRERPQLLVDLRDRSRELRKRLVKSCNGILKVVSWKDSPIIHLRIDKDASGGGRRLSRSSSKVSFTPTDGLEYDEYDIGFIIALKRACRMAGIAVSANRQGAITLVKYPFPPTLRLCVNVMLSDEELDECAHIVSTEAKRLLKDGGSFLHNSNF